MEGQCRNCGWCTNGKVYTRESINEELMNGNKLSMPRKKVISFFTNSAVVPDIGIFKKYFDGYSTPTSEQRSVKEKAQSIAKKIINAETVHGLLYGNPGTGKTHLACSIFNEVNISTSYRYTFCYVNWPMYISLLMQNIGGELDDKKKDKLFHTVSALNTASVAIIDDLGAERQTDFTRDKLDLLMQSREDKSVIISTNLSIDDLTEAYGGRTMSRITKYIQPVSFGGIKDYRQRITA